MVVFSLMVGLGNKKTRTQPPQPTMSVLVQLDPAGTHSRQTAVLTLVSAVQLMVPVFLIFQYLINLVPGRSRVPSGRFSSRNVAVMAGTTRGQGRFGRLGEKKRSIHVTELGPRSSDAPQQHHFLQLQLFCCGAFQCFCLGCLD